MARGKQTITMLRTGDVAWLLNVHSNTVRRWADQGIIRAYRTSPRSNRIFRRDDVAHLLDKLDV